jgi:hypothetical protein
MTSSREPSRPITNGLPHLLRRPTYTRSAVGRLSTCLAFMSLHISRPSVAAEHFGDAVEFRPRHAAAPQLGPQLLDMVATAPCCVWGVMAGWIAPEARTHGSSSTGTVETSVKVRHAGPDFPPSSPVLLIRRAQRARSQAETPAIVPPRFQGPALTPVAESRPSCQIQKPHRGHRNAGA